MAMDSTKILGGSSYGGAHENKLFSFSQGYHIGKGFFCFPLLRIVANLCTFKHDYDSEGDIIYLISANKINQIFFLHINFFLATSNISKIFFLPFPYNF